MKKQYSLSMGKKFLTIFNKCVIPTNMNVYNYVLIIIPIAVSCILRCLYIEKPEIGLDESFSLFMAQWSVPEIIRELTRGDNPPLWELLLHFWISITGINIVYSRILSMLFSVLTIVPIYMAGERFIGKYAGLAASIMYSFSTFSIFLAHDGRVYSLVGMLAAWSLYIFLSLILSERPKKLDWILLTIVNLLIMHSHYLAIWIIVVEFIAVVVMPSLRHKMWKGGIICILALIVSYIPMLPIITARFMDSGLHGTWISKCRGLADFYSMLRCFSNNTVPCILFIILIFFAIFFAIKKRNHLTPIGKISAILTILWLLPLFISFVLSFFVGFFFDRYFYFLFPVYFLALISYATFISKGNKKIIYIIYVLLPLLMVLSVKPDSTKLRYAGWKGDTSAVVERIKQRGNSNVIIAPYWIDSRIVYYMDTDHKSFANYGRLEQPFFELFLPKQGIYYADRPIQPKSDTVLVLHEKSWDINNVEQQLFEQGYATMKKEQYMQFDIEYYCKN